MYNALGWEKTLIGSVLSTPDLMIKAVDLVPRDFGCVSHNTLWGFIVALNNDNELDVRMLIETLREKHLLDDIVSPEDDNIKGSSYIAELLSLGGTNIDGYVEKVMSAAGRRSLQSVAGVISSLAQDENISYQEAMDEAEERLLAVRRNRSAEAGVTLGDIVGTFIPRLEKMLSGDFEPAWEPSIKTLRDVILYAEEDEYIVVAARPGDGKSSFLRREAAVNAAQNHKPTVIFNLENSHMEYARTMLAMYLGVDNQVLKNPDLMTPEMLVKVKEAARAIQSWPLHIVTLGSPSVNDILRVLRALVSEYDIQLAVIDYVQLISNPGTEGNQNANITQTSQKLRGASLSLKVPIIVAAQLNRGIENRKKGSDPMLSDLRGSGSLEQDATQVIFLRPWWQNPSPAQLGQFPENLDAMGNTLTRPAVKVLKMYVAKNRNGPVGDTDPVIWNMSTGKFISCTVEEITT